LRNLRSKLICLGLTGAAAVLFAGCGGGSSSTSGGSAPGGSSGAPSFAEALTNLEHAGYDVSVYKPNEGALILSQTSSGKQLKADQGLSIDGGPAGEQLYASIYEITDPRVLAVAKKSYGGTGDAEAIEGDLFFGISGTKSELDRIVSDATAG
jgi:hypothetical protein